MIRRLNEILAVAFCIHLWPLAARIRAPNTGSIIMIRVATKEWTYINSYVFLGALAAPLVADCVHTSIGKLYLRRFNYTQVNWWQPKIKNSGLCRRSGRLCTENCWRFWCSLLFSVWSALNAPPNLGRTNLRLNAGIDACVNI